MDNEAFEPVLLDLAAELAEAQHRPGFKAAWEASEESYRALGELLRARKASGLTQAEIAQRMGTTKSAF